MVLHSQIRLEFQGHGGGGDFRSGISREKDKECEN